jgi:membrane-bound inhibitor of C-type lysozyme
MTIEFKKVTWLSQVIAIIVFVGTFFVGFHLGRYYELVIITNQEIKQQQEENIINKVTFSCADNKKIKATFFKNNTVALELSDGRSFNINQTISGSGARFANSDESFIFWTKGDGAFIDENGEMTFKDCLVD